MKPKTKGTGFIGKNGGTWYQVATRETVSDSAFDVWK